MSRRLLADVSSLADKNGEIDNAYPCPPNDSTLVFAGTRQVKAAVTPFNVPHLIGMDLKDNGRDSRKGAPIPGGRHGIYQ